MDYYLVKCGHRGFAFYGRIRARESDFPRIRTDVIRTYLRMTLGEGEVNGISISIKLIPPESPWTDLKKIVLEPGRPWSPLTLEDGRISSWKLVS